MLRSMKKLFLIAAVFMCLMPGCAHKGEPSPDEIIEKIMEANPIMREILNFDFRWGETEDETRIRLPSLPRSRILTGVQSTQSFSALDALFLYEDVSVNTRVLYCFVEVFRLNSVIYSVYFDGAKKTPLLFSAFFTFLMQKMEGMYGGKYDIKIEEIKEMPVGTENFFRANRHPTEKAGTYTITELVWFPSYSRSLLHSIAVLECHSNDVTGEKALIMTLRDPFFWQSN